MDLSSTYKFEGWNVRYDLLKSDTTTGTDASKLRSVVFVHGTPWSSAVFRPVIEALLAKGPYQILVYDLPGYGKSQELDANNHRVSEDGFEGDTSVAFQARALKGLLENVQLDGQNGHPTPAVIAHDIAGTIVLRAHLVLGCNFNSMLLADANAVLPWGDGFYKLCRSNPQSFLQLPPSIFEAVVRAVTQSALHNPKVLESGWGDIIAESWVGSSSDDAAAKKERQRSFVRQIAQANDGDVAEMLDSNMYGKVGCDVKIVWGESDAWIPREKVEDLTRQLGTKAKEVAYIPKAGHLVMLDQPERFAIEVFDWLLKYGQH